MSLRTVIILSAAATLGLAFIVSAYFFLAGLNRYSQTTAVTVVETRSRALSSFVANALFEEWRSVEAVAARLKPDDPQQQWRNTVDSLSNDDEKVSWVGVARADGTVLAATRGMLEGENVASRPWFSEGIKGPFAGDVHEAVLLARLLQPDGNEPLRFIDFAAPILNEDGSVFGVLGAHVNWRWVRSVVAEAAKQLALDVFVVNKAGTVILSTVGVTEQLDGLPSFRAARLGSKETVNEVWPDGRTYYSTTMPEPAYQTLPPFGWRYVVRLDPGTIFGAAEQFRSVMLVGTGLALAGALLLLAILVGFFTRPLRELVEGLLDLAKGKPTGFFRERRRYRELGMLSEAIARLQSRSGAPNSPDRSGDNPSQEAGA